MKTLFYEAYRCICTAKKYINQSIDQSNKLEKEFLPIQTAPSNPTPHLTTTITPLLEATIFEFNVLLKLDLFTKLFCCGPFTVFISSFSGSPNC